MRTLRFLFCAACLCSVGAFAKTALTQDRIDPFVRPAKLKAASQNDAYQKGPLLFDDRSQAQPQPDARFSQPMRTVVVKETVSRTIQVPIPPEELETIKKLQTAIKQLSTGKDEESRKAAADTIQQQLTTQFAADLKQREKELEEVEQRVKSLREQLEKRKAAQADIINLRLQTLVNNANGLGFPDAGFGTGDGNRFTRDYALPMEVPIYQDAKPQLFNRGGSLPPMRDPPLVAPIDDTSDPPVDRPDASDRQRTK